MPIVAPRMLRNVVSTIIIAFDAVSTIPEMPDCMTEVVRRLS